MNTIEGRTGASGPRPMPKSTTNAVDSTSRNAGSGSPAAGPLQRHWMAGAKRPGSTARRHISLRPPRGPVP